MDTAQIVRQCRRLPGVTVREGEDYTERTLLARSGTGELRAGSKGSADRQLLHPRPVRADAER